MLLLVAVVALVALVASYVTWTAGRIDRLYTRVDSSYAALDAQLVRRAVAAEALPRAVAGERTDALRALARAARSAAPAEREAAENDLSRALRDLRLDSTDPRLAELTVAASRVGFARQFHNDAVRNTRALRGQRLPRALGLSRSRALPTYFEIDDSGLLAPGRSAITAPAPRTATGAGPAGDGPAVAARPYHEGDAPR